MGHTSDKSMSYYISGLVGIDSQSMVRGRKQKQNLLDENSSMMAKRNLLAPQPPGSQLIHQSLRPVREKVANITALTPREQYEVRRQLRNKGYHKDCKSFYAGNDKASEGASLTELPRRLPSRFLKALWKFQPDRKRVVDLVYRDGGFDLDTEIALESIVVPMINIAYPNKIRFAYDTAQPGPGYTCQDCETQLDGYVDVADVSTNLLI
jgi:hypothetical protein